MQRNLDFTYVNRIIAWNTMGKAFVYFLPFINIDRIKNFMMSSLKLTGYMDMDESDVTNICAICKTSHIVMPQRTNACKHIFCYYCAEVELEEQDKFNCPMCESEISEIEPILD